MRPISPVCEDATMRVRDACEQAAEAACAVNGRSIIELCILDHQCDPGTPAGWLANKTADKVRQWIGNHHVLMAHNEGAVLGVAAMPASGRILLNCLARRALFGVSKALIRGSDARAASLGLFLLTRESTSTATGYYRATPTRRPAPQSGPPVRPPVRRPAGI